VEAGDTTDAYSTETDDPSGGEDDFEQSDFEENDSEEDDEFGVDDQSLSATNGENLSLDFETGSNSSLDVQGSTEGNGYNHFDSTDLPVSRTGTHQVDLETQNFDSHGQKVPTCVILNRHGHLLTRTGHKLRLNKKHRSIFEKIVSKSPSKVIPLVYAEAQLFPAIFWQSLNDGTICGAMPTALWTDKKTLKRFRIASMRDHAKNRIRNPALLTSTDPEYRFMCLDQLCNLGARNTHTRLVLHRGFADHQGADGVTFRENSDNAELYGEATENHANVHKLSALVRHKQPHFFFTQSCNQNTCRGLRILREWVASHEAAVLLMKKYGLDYNKASRYLRESAASYVLRSWNEVVDLWMRYIIYSSEQPIGGMEYAWYRKEFQGEF